MERSTPIKILIADDEVLARKRVETFLEETPYAITILHASNGKQTIDKILSETPDLVFLDIKMTDMTGFDVLREIPKDHIPVIIFVTAFDTFAVKAFEVQALDFLLKPYKKARFIEALERGMDKLQQSKKQEVREKMEDLIKYISNNDGGIKDRSLGYLDKIVLKNKKKYIFVPVETICYIKASGYYAEIYTDMGHKHLYRISMTELIQKLNPDFFSRVNRSAIVNRDFIKEVVSEGMGDFSIVMNDKTSFSLSKTHKTTFLKAMGIK